MRIEEIHIDGFGVFNDKNIGPFHPGLSVVYGENEFGKTTLLEFVRRIMFGFPDKRSALNLYPAINGGEYGGRLSCRMADGSPLTINRSGTAKNGSLIITTAAGTLSGQEELNRLFRISPLFYKNVYAVTLDELEQLASLNDEEIRSRIYGAGLELGMLSLSELKNPFAAAADAIYMESGRNRLLQKLFQELAELKKNIRICRENLPRYQTLTGQLEQLEKETAAMSLDQKAQQHLLEQLKRKRELFNDCLDCINVQSRLLELASLPAIPENAVAELERLKSTQAALLEQHDRNTQNKKRLAASLAEIQLKPQWLERQGEIVALHKRCAVLDVATASAATVTARIDHLQRRLEEEIAASGTNFNPDSIREFNLPLPLRERSVKLKEEIGSLRENLKNSTFRLESDLTARRAAAVEQLKSGASLNRNFGIIVALCGLLAALIGLWQSPYLLAFGLLMTLCGFIGCILAVKNPVKPQTDRVDSPYRAELEETKTILTAKLNEWQQFVEETGLPAEIYPESFLPVVETLSRAKTLRQEMDAAGKELAGHRQTIAAIHHAHEALRQLLASPSDDITANAELLARGLAEQENAHRRYTEISEQLKSLESEASLLNAKIIQNQDELAGLLKTCGSENEAELRRNANLSRDCRELKNRHELLIRRMQQQIGINIDINSFVAELAVSDPVAMDNDIAQMTDRLQTVNTALEEKREELGSLKNEIQHLSTHDELLRLRNDEEVLKQRLRDAALDWAVNRTALRMVETAAAGYEQERQPGVIRQAGDIFKTITGGRYDSLFKPLEEDELYVRATASGRHHKVTELSRGTGEELYLAMRLGLIAEYEQRSEPMPLVLDDIMVNFDDVRASRALTAIAAFAASRQVIIMTCHRHVLELCLKAGARQVTF